MGWLRNLLSRLFGRKAKEADEAPLKPVKVVKKRILTAADHEPDIAAPYDDKVPSADDLPAVGADPDAVLEEMLMEEEQDHSRTQMPVLAPGSAPDVPVLVADLDGTLMGDPTSKYRRQFTPTFVQRIRDLQAQHNLVFVLNSGATYDRILQTLQSQPDPIWPDHLLLRESEIYHLTTPGKYVEHMPYNDQSRKLRADAIASLKGPVESWYPEWEKAVQIVKWQLQKYEIVIMLPDAEQANSLRDMIKKQLRMVKNVSVMSNRRVVAITCDLFDKRVVLEELLRHRGWQPRQVVAMGDDVNDLPILDGRLAVAACPANAVDPVKQAVRDAGGYISELTYGDGALDCLDQFMQQYVARRA